MLAVAEADIRKLIHDPVELLTRMIQPVLWLVVFGPVFSRTRGDSYRRPALSGFLAPGILAQSVLFGAIFYGISLIWERDLGIFQKYMVSPAPVRRWWGAAPSRRPREVSYRPSWCTWSRFCWA